MCTLTWLREAGAYELYFNRDEKRTRGTAEPPRVHEGRGTRYIAPTDPDFGGSWMAVNEHGLTVCLLNRWHEQVAEDREYRSRGLLVTDLASLSSVDELETAVRRLEPESYRPFTLVGLAPDAPTVALHWDGAHLRRESEPEDALPVLSSSVHFESVRRARREAYAEIVGARPKTADDLERFHRSRRGDLGSHWVCMDREDAATQCISHVRVDRREVLFRYLDREPATAPFGRALRLARPIAQQSGEPA